MALFTITHKYLNNSEMIQGFQYLYVGAYRQAERKKDFISRRKMKKFRKARKI